MVGGGGGGAGGIQSHIIHDKSHKDNNCCVLQLYNQKLKRKYFPRDTSV